MPGALSGCMPCGSQGAEEQTTEGPLEAVGDPPAKATNVWICTSCTGHAIAFRSEPDINAQKADHALHPGQGLVVSEERLGDNNVRFLKCADGRGWLFDHLPGVGTMCIREGEELVAWRCTVPQLEDSKWGLTFGVGRSYLQVQAIGKEGSFAKHNRVAPEVFRIAPGDLILEVDGVTDAAGMRAAFQKPELTKATLRVCRPRVKQLSISRTTASPWGAELGYFDDQLGVFMKAINPDGALERYNSDEATPEASRIVAGDIVTKLNTLSDGNEMVAAMKDESTMTLAIEVLILPVSGT